MWFTLVEPNLPGRRGHIFLSQTNNIFLFSIIIFLFIYLFLRSVLVHVGLLCRRLTPLPNGVLCPGLESKQVHCDDSIGYLLTTTKMDSRYYSFIFCCCLSKTDLGGTSCFPLAAGDRNFTQSLQTVVGPSAAHTQPCIILSSSLSTL